MRKAIIALAALLLIAVAFLWFYYRPTIEFVY
jgi:hypothetical protein